MVRIRKVIISLVAGLLVGACTTKSVHPSGSGSRFPLDQCELKVDSSSVGEEALVSTCAGDGVGSSSAALLGLANSSRIFFQKGVSVFEVNEGISLVEYVLDSYYYETQVGQVKENGVPDEMRRLLDRPLFVFIALYDDRVRVSFNSGSDAIEAYRQRDGSVAIDYVMY